MTKVRNAYNLWVKDDQGKWIIRNATSTSNSWMLDLRRMLEVFAERQGLDPKRYRILPAGKVPR